MHVAAIHLSFLVATRAILLKMDTKLTYFFQRPEAPRLDPPCYGIECHLVIILAAKSVCTPPLVYTHPRHRVVPDSSAVAAFLSLLEHPRGSYSIFTSVYFFDLRIR